LGGPPYHRRLKFHRARRRAPVWPLADGRRGSVSTSGNITRSDGTAASCRTRIPS
jgi:hypothetical protein